MGVFDKLKNVFFEEEYVEVEEPVKKIKKDRQAIAKKVDLPEMPKIKDEKTAREKEIEEEVVERVEKKGIESNSRRKENEFKFPMTFEDEDFEIDNYEKVKPSKSENKIETAKRSTHNEYNSKPLSNPYNMKKEDQKTDYSGIGLYEGGDYKKEPKIFKPTPIISPIYGVLDKNYKKEEIIQKKEVRLTSASSKKVDLDYVREKAYGDLASDITASMMGDEKDEKEVVNNSLEDSLYDLTDTDQPVVSSVTVGDAEEYFNDLGLEYNIDYKDHSKEKATGRRSEKIKEENLVESKEEDSLFDLIDSMYKDSEEE